MGPWPFCKKAKRHAIPRSPEIEFGCKMRNVRNVIIGLVLILLLGDPLHLTPPAPVTYEVKGEVSEKLKQANILTLPAGHHGRAYG